MKDSDIYQHANDRIAKRLQLVRRQHQLTLRQATHGLGITATRLEQIESGAVVASATELASLAQRFEMPIEFFLSGEPLLDCFGEWQLMHLWQRLPTTNRRRLIRLMLDLVNDVPVIHRD